MSTEYVISGQSHFVFIRMFDIPLAYLLADMEVDYVLPLWPLDTDPDQWYSGFPDAAVIGSYHIDGDPTLIVLA